MNELGKRVLTALVLIAAGWFWYVELPEDGFRIGAALIGLLASWELIALLRLNPGWAYLAGCLVFWGGFAFSEHWAMDLPLLLLFWFMLFALASRRASQSFEAFAAAAWLMFWLVATLFILVSTHQIEQGRMLILGACLGIWGSDIAAYFIGRALGRNKLCVHISPGKSVEGLIGGLIFGVGAAGWVWLQAGLFEPLQAVALGILVVLAGVLGDLSESSVKRMLGAKDSGRLLPGHGGILDRVDALLTGIPVAWLVGEMLT